MKILMVNPSQAKLPVEEDLIRADTYISIPLATELHKRNHSVSFLTAKDSSLAITQIKTHHNSLFSIMPIRTFYASDHDLQGEFTKLYFSDILLKCREIAKKEQFDIIHVHSNYFLLELALLDSIKDIPIVITLHSVPEDKVAFSKAVSEFDLHNRFFISISDKQRQAFPYPFTSTVHNGIDMNHFNFNKMGGESLLFSGRLRKLKGIEEAMTTSVKTGRKLLISGKSDGASGYVKETIEPFVQKNASLISHLRLISRTNMQTFYQQGKLILFPILWEEPFGLVQIESMACGTPVVAYARGSVPEVIKDGETGFIVNSSDDDLRGDWIIKKTGIDGLCEAIEKIYSMSKDQYLQMRKNCRAHVEKNFTVEKMVDEYEKVYEKILQRSKTTT